jgi:amino acid adenylation domain-containing protein
MTINLLEYLDNIVKICPDKPAFTDGTQGLTFGELRGAARAIGTRLLSSGAAGPRRPVVVYMPKKPQTIAAFFGVIYSGNIYVPIDDEMPASRIEAIFKSLNPAAVICDGKISVPCNGEVLRYSDIIQTPVDETALAKIRKNAIDTDPIYIVFTSGSTGIPKGVAACHRSVIDYTEQLSETLGLDGNTVFGSQTPLYVDACLKELIPTIRFGATTYLIPKELFMFPIKLVEYLNEHKINTVCWVVSALAVVSGLGALDKLIPQYLHTVAFGSEVFAVKQLNKWRQALPGARFFNLYGPTECTGMSCWYEVTREFAEGEPIPIGQPFRNTRVMLLDGDTPAENGELCITGTPVTLGYYNEPGRTNAVFTQNPLNSAYHELIYRTGDICRYNEYGELIFVSRRDHQIKHMGHRIELGEIEAAAAGMDGAVSVCCLFDEQRKKIKLYYTGEAETAEMAEYLKTKLPRYMRPNAIKRLAQMPLLPNGKIDRKGLSGLR